MGRHSENTEYLKGSIPDALLQLMENSPIDKITIQEITGLTGSGRMAYFRHLCKAWREEHPCTYKIGCYERALWFVSFWYSLRRLLPLLYRQKQYDALLQVFLSYAALVEDGPRREQYQQMFFAGGLLGIVMKWIATGFKETPDALTALCSR